ncbi:MAG TPA: ATP-binding protein [Acetobacteraceae bacterium]|nr:ATP-binding protein [Acetobacteraceae bacterium]
MSRLWRVTPAIAAATVVVLLLAAVFLGHYIDRANLAQKVTEATEQAKILASTASAAVAFSDRQAAGEYLGAIRANPEVEWAAIYDAKGQLFASFSRSDGRPPDAAPPLRPPFVESGHINVLVPIVQKGNRLGTVYLHTPTEPVERRLERYAVIGLFAVMAALIVAVLGIAQGALTRANTELARRAGELALANTSLREQIEQREKVEEALRQAQKMEAIGQLTGGVAHDFNNLLQVILGNLERLRRRALDPMEAHRLIDAALRGAERAATLTQRLLAFSRRQPLAPKVLEVNKLVTGMSDLLSRTLGENIRIETVLAGGLWRVSADENQLESALLNLAVNARDAMQGAGKLTIETGNAYLDDAYVRNEEEVKPGQYVLIAVSDTGSGMSKDILDRVFEPFFTTKEIGQGTGLGLSMVYGFVKQSGGHVKLYSELGQGTTVKLYLPRLLTEPAQAQAPQSAASLPRGHRNELVLVVEDEDDVRALTVDTLQELGYDVLQAMDGASALRLLESEPGIRLLFTDVGLPGGLNGRQLADAARQTRPGLKVLFTTGYARNAIVHHGRLDPGVQLISKPFSDTDLAHKVRQMLDGTEV